MLRTIHICLDFIRWCFFTLFTQVHAQPFHVTSEQKKLVGAAQESYAGASGEGDLNIRREGMKCRLELHSKQHEEGLQ
jgi:hypothetical protein